MKHLKKYEDVYYEPQPESFGSWKNRVQKLFDDFCSEFVKNNVGDDSEFLVEITPNRIRVGVHYKPEERYTGPNKDSIKEDWRLTMDEMIEALQREFGREFKQHHLTENGFIVETDVE